MAEESFPEGSIVWLRLDEHTQVLAEREEGRWITNRGRGLYVTYGKEDDVKVVEIIRKGYVGPNERDPKWAIFTQERPTFEQELRRVINHYSVDNLSNTPDYILASFLSNVLTDWNHAVLARDRHGDISDANA